MQWGPGAPARGSLLSQLPWVGRSVQLRQGRGSHRTHHSCGQGAGVPAARQCPPGAILASERDWWTLCCWASRRVWHGSVRLGVGSRLAEGTPVSGMPSFGRGI